jgi:phage RecT family recombinase
MIRPPPLSPQEITKMSNEVSTRSENPNAMFRSQFERMTSEIGAALPPHIPVERFMRVVLTAVNGNPDLIDADRRSLFEASMKAAQDGLLPDGRDGALVVYNTKVKVQKNGREVEEWIKKVQWMPMISGILKKVRNSGDLLSIAAHVAFEHDEFTYSLGDEEKIEHKPAIGKDRGKPLLVYAVAKTKDGGIYRDVMTVEDVEKVRNVSRAKNSGPWTTWWDEMAKKTVLRRLSKRLPMSSDLDDLIRRDDELYDFSGKRADAPDGGGRGFTPLKNPLADDGHQIEHNPETGEITDSVSGPLSDDAGVAATDATEGGDQTAVKATPEEAAEFEGADARARGVSRKAVPPEYRAEGASALAEAWQRGWDAKNAELSAGGANG